MPTTTILPEKQGIIVGPQATSHGDARDATGGTAITSGQQQQAVGYLKSSGRGGGFFRFTRAFFGFELGSFNTTITAANLIITSAGTLNSADIIVVPDNSENLASGDMDTPLFSTALSSEISTWSANGSSNTIALNSSALSLMNTARQQVNDAFIIAIVEKDHDFNNLDNESDVSLFVGIDLGTNGVKLQVTHADSGFGHPTIGVASANIAEIKGVATANIAEVIGV